ncbi:hypothetical protein ACSBR1_011868 [Camellia fascicularis]
MGWAVELGIREETFGPTLGPVQNLTSVNKGGISLHSALHLPPLSSFLLHQSTVYNKLYNPSLQQFTTIYWLSNHKILRWFSPEA